MNTNDIESLKGALQQILPEVFEKFWQKGDFWINLVIGIAGLVFSILAFSEARKAKRAATEAGRTVKIQTVTIDLTEIAQKLDRLNPKISYTDARDLLTEISRKLRRIVSPFGDDPKLATAIGQLKETLDAAKAALDSVRPADIDSESSAPNAVYNAVEGFFADISNLVADLLGLFEKENLGERNGKE